MELSRKIYDKQFTTVTTHKNFQNNYNEKCAKYLMFALKNTEQLSFIALKGDKFDEFLPKRLKVSKIFIWMCSSWAKYILFELKKHRGVIFHETEEGYKIWKGIDSFQNWHNEFDKFWPEHSKVTKIFTLMGSL